MHHFEKVEFADMATQIKFAVDQLHEGRIWVNVHIILISLPVVPLLFLWLVSLCLVRRRHEHGGLGFLWIKLATPLFSLGLLLDIIADVAELYAYDYEGIAINRKLVRLEFWSSWFGSMFILIAHGLLLIALAEIGDGLLLQGNKARPGHDSVRRGTWKLAFILTGVASARTGFGIAAWNRYFDFQEDSALLIIGMGPARVADGVGAVMLWFGTGVILAFAIFVARKLKEVPHLKSSVILFLVAAVLLFIRDTWNLVYASVWTLPGLAAPGRRVPDEIPTVDAILEYWVTFIVLVLLFVLGTRK